MKFSPKTRWMLLFRQILLFDIFSLRSLKKFGFLCLLPIVFYLVFGGFVNVHYPITQRREYGKEKADCPHQSQNLRKESENLYTKGRYWKNPEPFTHKDPSGHDKFVIFDVEEYSGSLEFLNDIPIGWVLFVINHKHDAQLDSCPNCLNFIKSAHASGILETIKRGHAKDASLLPSSALTKMAASIFALENKAPWIYVTNIRSRVPFDTLTTVIMNHPEKGMVYKGPKRIFQPCSHFMDTFTWNGKGLLKDQNRYVLRSLPPTSLYQITDKCYKHGMDADWQNFLDLHAPIPFVMPGNWAAVDFQNILVPRMAAWTLMASIRLKFSKDAKKVPSAATSYDDHYATNAIVSLLVQRFLWETENIIGFVPGTTDWNANSVSMSCPTCDVELSMDQILSIDKGHTGNVLMNWPFCSKKVRDIEDCLSMAVKSGLTKRLSLSLNIGHKPIEALISTWVKLLKDYRIPTDDRTSLNKDILSLRFQGNEIYFTPAKSLHQEDKQGNSQPPNTFWNVCARNERKYSGIIPDNHPEIFDSVVMVISFNFPKHMSSISFLEYMFGRHFKHILYCAPGVKGFENGYLKRFKNNPVSFIDVKINSGYYGHLCAVAASEMNYFNVTGYLYLSDDVILNVWNLYNQPFYLPWFQADIRIVNLNSSFAIGHEYGNVWYPWNKPTGKPAITRSMDVLKSLTNDTRAGIGDRVRWFLRNLRQMSSGCENCIAYMDADLYYLPSYMASDFRFFVPFFEGVFQELSVPTLLAGITPQPDLNIYRLRGHYLIGAYKRERFEKGWSPEEIFVHPVKLSVLRQRKKFFCDFLRRTDEDLMFFQNDLKINP